MKTRHHHYPTMKMAGERIIIGPDGLHIVQSDSTSIRLTKAKYKKLKEQKIYARKTKQTEDAEPKRQAQFRGRRKPLKRLDSRNGRRHEKKENKENKEPSKRRVAKAMRMYAAQKNWSSDGEELMKEKHRSVDDCQFEKSTESKGNSPSNGRATELELNAHDWHNREMFMHAIDANDVCYAVRLFTTSYDPTVCSPAEYLEQSLDQAETVCKEISLGTRNVRRNPNITECNSDSMSPMMYENIVKFLKFERDIKKLHVREKRLRDLDESIVRALSGFQLRDLMQALDELNVLFNQGLNQLVIKKQPYIVCRMIDLINRQVDDTSNGLFAKHWSLVKTTAARVLDNVKAIFEFNGTNREFGEFFLLEMRLFTKLTTHFNPLELYELTVDPVQVVQLDTSDPLDG